MTRHDDLKDDKDLKIKQKIKMHSTIQSFVNQMLGVFSANNVIHLMCMETLSLSVRFYRLVSFFKLMNQTFLDNMLRSFGL